MNRQMTLRLEAGKTFQLRPRFFDQMNKPIQASGSITYTSSNPAIASVNSSGVISAVAAGSCTITATCGSLTAQKSLMVNPAPPAPAPYTPAPTKLVV